MSRNTWLNLGKRSIRPIGPARFPDISELVHDPTRLPVGGSGGCLVLLVNPPSPDGGVWIRSQHRVGRRSRENMLWPQVSLATLAACLQPQYRIQIIDAIATRMTWPEFEAALDRQRPRYYLSHVTAPTLTNDMYGVFLAKSKGAVTIAFGTHVTPNSVNTMTSYPALDFILRGEPELSLRELIDALEGKTGANRSMESLMQSTDPTRRPISPIAVSEGDLSSLKGLAWRDGGRVKMNPDRPFIDKLDALPLPLHDQLPLNAYRMPLIRGPYTFVVTSRGCPAGCTFCIKHASYNDSVRIRSPENVMAELRFIRKLGIKNVVMYADLFTVNRDQVVDLCRLMIAEKLGIQWLCNSRVDFIDDGMLRLMQRAGCRMISWGIESASRTILQRARKGASPQKAVQALRWSRAAGIKNFGYFIIGLPGETEMTIRETIAFAKRLPLDFAIFHIAAPHPGTPFFYEVIENQWFRAGTQWECVDMDDSTVLDYENLSAERLSYWQRRATREWALRPGPLWAVAKSLNTWAGIKSALSAGIQTLAFIKK